MGIIEQRPHSPEQVFEEIPILSIDDISEGSGFSSEISTCDIDTIFIDALAQAISDPQWILSNPRDMRFSDQESIRMYRGHHPYYLKKVASDINKGDFIFPSYHGVNDLVARAYGKLQTSFPNLTLFAGGQLTPGNEEQQMRFAPGNLHQAIRRAQKFSSHNSVIAFLSAKSFEKKYREVHPEYRINISVPTDKKYSPMWSRSFDISFFTKSALPALRRLPSSQEEIDTLLDVFEQHAITLDSSHIR